jgi:hypothetical protein
MHSAGQTRHRPLHAAILALLIVALCIPVHARATAMLPAQPDPTPSATGCTVSSGTWVNLPLSQTQTGSFRVTLDATPSGAAIDGVTGLSNGTASNFSSLAAAVRFNDTGHIDARSGGNYISATSIPYAAGTAYHFILDVNIPAHTYNAYVMIGSVQTTIGLNLSFRTEQAAVSSLNNVGSLTSPGSESICNVVDSPLSTPCTVSSGTWVNLPLSQTQTGSFRVTLDATPSGAAIDGVTGLSNGTASNFTGLAVAVRFNDTGHIDARSGGNYLSATSIPYAAGTAYHFILDVNIPAHTYNAYVMIGSVQTTIGLNLSFRTEQATVSSLNNVGSLTSPGSETICNVGVSVQSAAPAITTQPLSQVVAVGQTAAFSVAAAGTAPLTFQWKRNGASISGATSATYTTAPTTLSDNGVQFTVVVSNSQGTATSNAATLTVNALTLLLNANPTTVSFGNVIMSQTASQNVTLLNAGTSAVTISGVSISGAGFNAGGMSGLILAPAQTASLNVTFSPTATGAVTGKVMVSSTASNSPDTIVLSGTGMTAVQHSASLSWSASTSTVIGYYVYSGTTSGGPYAKLNSTPIVTLSYTDTTVQAGKTYYYVVTSVDSSNNESAFSNQSAAAIP